MKKQTLGLVIVGVALVIVVFLSLAFQSSVSPHNSCKMAFSNIEGMESSFFDEKMSGAEEADPTDSISWLEKEEKKKQENAKKEGLENNPKKVEGFSLHPASVGDYQPIDYFSSLKAGDCKASGYTKNSGNLCLDERAMQLLRTRGGNMTSGEAQIGV